MPVVMSVACVVARASVECFLPFWHCLSRQHFDRVSQQGLCCICCKAQSIEVLCHFLCVYHRTVLSVFLLGSMAAAISGCDSGFLAFQRSFNSKVWFAVRRAMTAQVETADGVKGGHGWGCCRVWAFRVQNRQGGWFLLVQLSAGVFWGSSLLFIIQRCVIGDMHLLQVVEPG
jgi:hypothetical protein